MTLPFRSRSSLLALALAASLLPCGSVGAQGAPGPGVAAGAAPAPGGEPRARPVPLPAVTVETPTSTPAPATPAEAPAPTLAAAPPAPPPAALRPPDDASRAAVRALPLGVTRATGTPAPADARRVVILLTGNGGARAGLPRQVASRLAARGVPVVTLDALRYFWKERPPETVAADVDALIRETRAVQRRPDVTLVGFAQGAEVLPFVLNRLPLATRETLSAAVLLAPRQTAAFEFHAVAWLGLNPGGVPVEPEVARLPPRPPLVCIQGTDDDASLCPDLGPGVRKLAINGARHFDRNYARLADAILATLPLEPGGPTRTPAFRPR